MRSQYIKLHNRCFIVYHILTQHYIVVKENDYFYMKEFMLSVFK